MKEIEVLSKYGTVKTCKVVKEEIVTIVLVDYFTDNFSDSLKFLISCQELFPDYPNVETCITEKACAIVVLTK